MPANRKGVPNPDSQQHCPEVRFEEITNRFPLSPFLVTYVVDETYYQADFGVGNQTAQFAYLHRMTDCRREEVRHSVGAYEASTDG